MKTAMWRQARGFDVGFTETQIAPLGKNYHLITSSEFPLSAEISKIAKPSDIFEPLCDIQGLQSKGQYIWGSTHNSKPGYINGYFIFDMQADKKYFFKANEEKIFKTELSIRNIGEEKLYSPYDFYLKEVKKLNQPGFFSLALWFDKKI